MEHDLVSLSDRTGIVDPEKLRILLLYADLIFCEKQRFNLTGHKSLNEIIENLIIGSLEPVANLNVPRGTFFADLGSGAGIPGIPFAVKYPEISGFLFESNHKKTGFITKTAADLKILNVKAVNMRIEEAGRMSEFREKFDLVLTRAMSDLYTIVELGSPLLKTGGHIYVYTNINTDEIRDYVSDHIRSLGLAVIKDQDTALMNKRPEGILIKKIRPADEKFPRRMAVIKRMAERNAI